jgi:hypothetical protein
MSRWWSLAQTLVWIIRRIEMLPREAEQIANSSEMSPKIEGALNELKREACKAVLRVTEGMPVDKFRILCGHHYIDLRTLIQIPRTAEPGALSAILRELQEGIRWQDVECNSDWLKHAWPAPAPDVDASVPTATTEAAASPSPVDTTTTETAAPSPESATLTDLTNIEAKSEAASTDTKRADQSQSIAPFYSGGGRPTDRDLLLSEADWRLRHERRPKTLRAFARDVLRPWLDEHGEHRGLKTQEVMKVETIEDHVRSLWNRREKPAKNR